VQTIGNILWLVLAGFWLAVGYVIAGLLAFVLIVTIPFGIASFRLAGWELALMQLLAGALLMITIIGIPFGVACWKMIPLSLLPLGRKIVPISSVANDPNGIPA
jgi:uncharacterized membrane protein YccF (DUF307 family)